MRQMHISYYRKKVNTNPVIRCGPRTYNGKVHNSVWKVEDSRRSEIHYENTPKGISFLKTKNESDHDSMIVSKLESEWIGKYGTSCQDVDLTDYEATPNRQLFDSLVCGKNPYNVNYKLSYNGILFNSNLELQFAKIMDDYGIPYKYEPEITVYDGRNRYPDFVIYLPWLDLIILVEIFGLCDKDNYINSVRDRIYDYMKSGWQPGRSMMMLYHYDQEIILPEMIMDEIETVAMREYLLMNKAA